ncbi:MAG: hypothetical protein GX333_02785 [Syntrophomonadaceae bacterium]|nr:hypothetical protein [Syntrophomonadaceae bacterium]
MPIDGKTLNSIAEKAGLPSVQLINTRSQVFKKLGLDINNMSEAEALALMVEYPRIIIRPIVISNNMVIFRFVEQEYREHLLS